jgi:hypothetical protein
VTELARTRVVSGRSENLTKRLPFFVGTPPGEVPQSSRRTLLPATCAQTVLCSRTLDFIEGSGQMNLSETLGPSLKVSHWGSFRHSDKHGKTVSHHGHVLHLGIFRGPGHTEGSRNHTIGKSSKVRGTLALVKRVLQT